MKRLGLLLSMFFIFSILSIELASAKSYSYSYINIVLDLEKNGSVFVSQERAYDFRGSFSWAFLDLKKKGSSDIDFIQIKDLDTDELLNYDIEEDNIHVKATWYYTANNQVKRFLITYEIKDAVKRYNDVADFYWKVIEEEHESIASFNAEANIPEPSPDLFKLFVHSASKPGTMVFSDDYKKVSVAMQNIPKNRFVEFRLLTSPSIFSDVGLIGKGRYETILNEERSIFFQNMVLSNIIFLYPVLLIPLVVIFLYFYFKYGVEPKVKYEGIYERDFPMKIPPMALAYLVAGRFEKRRSGVRGFIATILDLARRKYLNIKEEKKKHLKFFEKKEQRFVLTKKGKKELTSPKKLLDFELLVLNFLFRTVPSGRSKTSIRRGKIYPEVTSSDIVNWNRRKRLGLSFISSLFEKASSWFESKHFRIHTKLSMTKRNLFLIVSISYLFLISILLIAIQAAFIPWVILGGLLVGLFLALGSIPILRQTPESALALKKWNAFKKFITDFSAMKDAPTTLIHIWDEYLVYAVVLGVAVKLLKNLKMLAEEHHIAFAAAGWYYGAGVTKAPTGVMSPEAFSSLVSNLSGTINALNSSSSVGGGFSGGAAGAGGGGGGGSSGAG